MTELPREPDDLFALRPEEFTAARNALAKRLKSEGQAGRAAEVQALRRPTATAWALNQLARQRPELVNGVITAGEQLRRAMEKAMGGDRSEFQGAQSRERTSIQKAVDAASTLMAAAGDRATEAVRQRIADTLRAAAVDVSVADLLRRGVLETDMSAPGFGLDGISADVVKRQVPAKPDDDSRQRARKARLEELRLAKEQAERRLEKALIAAKQAEERAARLRSEADAAQKEFDVAENRLDEESGS
jgi:hypothetical protein